MTARFWVAAAVSLAVCGQAQAAETSARYVCGGGEAAFDAVFSADGSALTLAFAGQAPVALKRAISGAEFRYVGGGYELHGKEGAVMLARPGAAPISCEVAQSNANRAADVATPSFTCGDKLGPAERQICSDAKLAGLDRRLADAYRASRERLRGAARQSLVRDQRRWLGERNRCKSDARCLEARYGERLAALDKRGGQGAIRFPRAAQSLGGVVRSGSGLKHKRTGSLREGAPITLLGDTGVEMNGYNWFKIRFRRRIGYHWGGLICAKGGAIPGTFKVCN